MTETPPETFRHITDMEQEKRQSETEAKPRTTRQPKPDNRRLVVYRMIDGKPKEEGSFPDTTIGAPVERRLPAFLKEVFGPGQYKVDIRNKGRFMNSLEIDLSETELESENIIDADELMEDELETSLPDSAGPMSAEVENVLLKERLRRLEEQNRKPSGPQVADPTVQALITALDESRREQREMMMMMLAQAQKPAQDATVQAMSMLEKSFGMISKARDLSEMIAPSGGEGSGGGLMADGAKLIDSLGRNAGTFLPILSGLMPKVPTPSVPTPEPVETGAPASSNGTGEFTDLAKKIRKKDPVKK